MNYTNPNRTGKRTDVNGISIMNFRNGQWAGNRIFADELGVLLQLGRPNLLLE